VTLEAVLGSTVGAIQAVMVSIWDDTSRAVLISVVAGIVLYFVRSWADGRRVTQSLARALHFELEENQREIMSARFSGLSQANPIKIDGVYRGLLASGNIRYLHKHQESLYRLYSMKSSDNPELLDPSSPRPSRPGASG